MTERSALAQQLVLDLPVLPSNAREDFVSAPSNRDALSLIEQWPDWPSNALILTGEAGAGKTHLAEIWRVRTKGACLQISDLASRLTADMSALAYILEDADDPLCDHNALFHLINLAKERGFYLLLTARKKSGLWPVTLKDLASRLTAMPSVALAPPDDFLLAAVMTKLFTDRQVLVEPGLISYLVARMERSLAAANRLVERLDAAALIENRPITTALAARLLDADDHEKHAHEAPELPL